MRVEFFLMLPVQSDVLSFCLCLISRCRGSVDSKACRPVRMLDLSSGLAVIEWRSDGCAVNRSVC